MARVAKDTKPHNSAVIEAAIANLRVPYMTQEMWAKEVGLSKEAVRLRLNEGTIERYQPVSGGTIFVNAYMEWRKILEEAQRIEAEKQQIRSRQH